MRFVVTIFMVMLMLTSFTGLQNDLHAQVEIDCSDDCRMEVVALSYLEEIGSECTYVVLLEITGWDTGEGVKITKPNGQIINAGVGQGGFFDGPLTTSEFPSYTYTVSLLSDSTCTETVTGSIFCGYSYPPAGLISGKVLCGFNGVEGLGVSIFDDAGNFLEEVFTDEYGIYYVTYAGSGTYTVVPSALAGATLVGNSQEDFTISDEQVIIPSFNFLNCGCLGTANNNVGCNDIISSHSVVCNVTENTYSVGLTFGSAGNTDGYAITLPDGSQIETELNYALTGPFDLIDEPNVSFTITALDDPTCSVTLGPVQSLCFTDGGPLPIELMEFAGEPRGKLNYLHWKTSSEQNNDHFTVSRSEDGDIFELVTEIASQGNSSTLQFYEFEDYEYRSDLTYYKLEQTNLDGNKKTVGNIIAVQRPEPELVLSDVYPIPSSDFVTLVFAGNQSHAFTINIFDLRGRLIDVHTVALGNQSQYRLDVSDYEVGCYLIGIDSGAETVMSKFVKN